MSRKYKQDDILVETSTLENVNNKTQNDIDTAENKISSIKNDIETLQVSIEENSSALLLIVRGSENFEGKDVTAKCKLDNSEYIGTIQNGVCILKVKMPGEYVITNTFNETTITCTIGEPLIDEVYFTDYYGSINVTVPEMLIGETLVAVNEHHTTEKVITSTIEIIDVYFKGSWEVKIKDTEYISGQSVELQELGQSASVSFTSLESVPYITVTLCDELKTERVVCTSDNDYTRTKSPKNGSVQFFCPKAGSYTVALELSDKIQKQVEVSATQEYPVTLDLTELTTPVLIVKSKEEDNGKTIKVSKDETNLERVLADRVALFVLPEQGEWTVSCDDYPEVVKSCNASENQVYNIIYRANIFGLKVIQAEPDPKQRIEPLEDLVGLTPITVDQDSGTVNYGDMDTTFLFKAMDNPVLKSIDKSEEIELDSYDYSKLKIGGNAPSATLADNYNQFSRIDKLYTYQYDKDGYEYYYISDMKIDDNYTAVGFTKEDSSEADYSYFASFGASFDEQNRCRSVSGVNMRNYTTYTDFSTAVKKNGDGYYMEQHQQFNLLEISFLMMFQNFNISKVFGAGRTIDGGSESNPKTKQTTGFANNKGPIAYDPESKAIKFMHIEDFYMYSGRTWEEGIMFQKSITYVRMQPPYISKESEGTSTYIQSSKIATKSGFISASTADNKYGRLPSTTNGSETTYECCIYSPTGNSQDYPLYSCTRGGGQLFDRKVDAFGTKYHYIITHLSLLD